MKKKIGIGILVVVLVVGGFFVIKGLTASEAKQAKQVKVQQVKPQKMVTTVNADGTVKANRRREVKTDVSGTVEMLAVEEGARLKVGDKLAQLKDDSLEEKLELAQIDLKEARQNYTDLQNKYNRQQKVDNLNLNQAKYRVQEAKQSLAKKKIELQSRVEEVESNLETATTKLEQLEEKVTNKQKLYQQQAITKQELETIKERYQTQQQATKRLQKKLKRLKEETMPSELKLARLKVEKAQTQLQLSKTKTEQVTKEKLASARLKVKRAQTKLNNLQSKLQKLKITAPIKGTVVDLPVESGDKLAEDSQIASIASVNDLVVEAMVDEVDISEVATNQQVVITSEAYEQEFSGRVEKIAPAAIKDGNINKFTTDIKLTEATPLKLGMFVTAEITTNTRQNVIAVPQIAVFGDQNKYIYIVQNGKAAKKEVEIGLSNLEKVQVKGIKPGTKVIVGPFTTLKQLKPGLPVTAKQNQKK